MLTDIRDLARDIRKSGEWKTPVAAASAFILCMSYLLWGVSFSHQPLRLEGTC